MRAAVAIIGLPRQVGPWPVNGEQARGGGGGKKLGRRPEAGRAKEETGEQPEGGEAGGGRPGGPGRRIATTSWRSLAVGSLLWRLRKTHAESSRSATWLAGGYAAACSGAHQSAQGAKNAVFLASSRPSSRVESTVRSPLYPKGRKKTGSGIRRRPHGVSRREFNPPQQNGGAGGPDRVLH